MSSRSVNPLSHRRVVYLSSAANCDGPLPSRLRGVNQPVMRSSSEVSGLRAARLASWRTHLPHVISRSSGSAPAYSAWGCGHGGTRNMSTSRRLHTRSVNPAAIAGVWRRHCWPSPCPWSAQAGARAGVSWREAGRNCDRCDTMPGAAVSSLPPCTTWAPATQWPPHVGAG